MRFGYIFSNIITLCFLIIGNYSIGASAKIGETSSSHFNSSINQIKFHGDYIYVSSFHSDVGITVFHYDLENPTEAYRYNEYGKVTELKFLGNLMYVLTWNNGFLIYDVTDPLDPIKLSQTSLSGHNNEGLDIKGDYLYIRSNGSLKTFNISDPSNPYFVNSITHSHPRSDIKVYNDILIYTGYNLADGGIHIYDISNPQNPTHLSTTDLNSYARSFEVYQSDSSLFLYLACVDDDAIHVYSLDDPENPVLVSVISNEFTIGANSLQISNKSLVLINSDPYSDSSVNRSITTYDLSDPINPILINDITENNSDSFIFSDEEGSIIGIDPNFNFIYWVGVNNIGGFSSIFSIDSLLGSIKSLEELDGYTFSPNPLIDSEYENDENAIFGFYDSVIYQRTNDGEWNAQKVISYSYNTDDRIGTIYVDLGDFDQIDGRIDSYRKLRVDVQFLSNHKVEYTYYYVLENGNEIRLNYPDGSPMIVDGILQNTGFTLNDLPINQGISDFPESQDDGFNPNIWGTSHTLEDTSGEVNSLLSFDFGWEVVMASTNNNRFHLEMIGADYRTIGFGFTDGYGLDSAFVFEIYTEGTNQSDEVRKLLFDSSHLLGQDYFLKVIYNPYTKLLFGYYKFLNDLDYNLAFNFDLGSGEITFYDGSINYVSSWLNLSDSPKFIQPGMSSGINVPFLQTEDEIFSFKVIIDSDADGVPNEQDAFPFDPNESIDTDQDGIGNNEDLDDDDDDYLDNNDAFPLDRTEWMDTDNDGIGDNADEDDDNDLLLDLKELQLGTDPLIADNLDSLIPVINQLDIYGMVQDIRPGSSIIEIHNGQAILTMEVQESDDLSIWTDRTESSVHIPIDAEAGKKFFRFKMAE